MSFKYQCVCLLLLVWTLAIEGYKQRRPPGCFRSLRHCRDKCCGNGKTCKSIFYRGCTWYMCSLVDCGTLSDPAYGHVTTHPGHAFESTATYSCNDGYELDGQSTRTCLSTCHWSGNKPTCKLVDCGPLDPPCHGNVSVPATTYGSNATYYCDPDRVLIGHETRMCQGNGHWSGSLPCCEEVATTPSTTAVPSTTTLDPLGTPPGPPGEPGGPIGPAFPPEPVG